MSATTRPLTCEELEPLARDAARASHPERDREREKERDRKREQERNSDELPLELMDRIRAHVDGCAACAARLARERRLDAELAALSAGEASPGPSLALERRILRAYQERFSNAPLHPPHRDPRALPGRSRRPGRAPFIAVAASLGLAVVAVALSVGQRRVDPPIALETAPATAPPIEERAALPIASGSPDLAGPVAELMPLGWDARVRPVEIGRITRVRMPTSVAAHFGWPLLPDAPEARVAAEVLIGEDGTARALRFLPATFTPVSESQGGGEP